MWADRESYLSPAEGACTLIRPRVQPCGWKSYVRAFTVIDSSTNRTVESMGGIILRTSQLEPDVRLSPHPAPDVLSLRFAHVDIVVAAFVNR